MPRTVLSGWVDALRLIGHFSAATRAPVRRSTRAALGAEGGALEAHTRRHAPVSSRSRPLAGSPSKTGVPGDQPWPVESNHPARAEAPGPPKVCEEGFEPSRASRPTRV